MTADYNVWTDEPDQVDIMLRIPVTRREAQFQKAIEAMEARDKARAAERAEEDERYKYSPTIRHC